MSQQSDELCFNLKENIELKKNLERIIKLKYETEKNKHGVEDYFKSLKLKFKPFVAAVI